MKTTEKGLGGEHQKTRRRLLPLAYGKNCAICGYVMLEGHHLELDHIIPRALGGHDGPVRIVHATCNHRLGGHLGKHLRKVRRNLRASRW